MAITLKQLNGLSREAFTAELGKIFEHSSWVAAEAWDCRPFATTKELHEAMLRVVRESGEEMILTLLRAHPDLGTRLAVAEYSAKEQKGAGLSELNPEEYEKLAGLNKRYVEKFAFPFILAVKGKTKEDIIAAMEDRIQHSIDGEREQALVEIGKITGFRLHEFILE